MLLLLLLLLLVLYEPLLPPMVSLSRTDAYVAGVSVRNSWKASTDTMISEPNVLIN